MKQFLTFAFSCLALALVLSACSKSEGGGSAADPGYCQPGYLNSQWGCQPIHTCTNGMVYYNNMCQMPFNNFGYNQCTAGLLSTQYGCYPQGSCPVGQAQAPQGCVPVVTTPINNYPGGYPNNGYPGYPGGYTPYNPYPTGYPPGWGYAYGYSYGSRCYQSCNGWGCFWKCY